MASSHASPARPEPIHACLRRRPNASSANARTEPPAYTLVVSSCEPPSILPTRSGCNSKAARMLSAATSSKVRNGCNEACSATDESRAWLRSVPDIPRRGQPRNRGQRHCQDQHSREPSATTRPGAKLATAG